MSANKNLVERYIEGFNNSDHEQILSCLTEDVVWDIPGAFHISGKDAFDKEIAKEINKSKKGGTALIRIKVNNLEDIHMIDRLYEAGRAGVKVQLLVRSICCIVPGKKGLSEHIEVKRIVDQFLEHSRIFIFGSGEDSRFYIGSADWMTRNLRRRIEVCITWG